MTLYTGIQPLPLGTLSPEPPTPPPDVSITIQGNNAGNIYAGNRFNTIVGAVAGDLITLVTSSDIPLASPLPRPIDGRPRDFAALIGRTTEIRTVSGALAGAEPVELHAAPGMGKTSLLHHLAWRLAAPPDGVYHLRAAGRPPEDLEEQIFAGFFTSQFPIKQYHAQLLEHLRPLQALIIVDDLSVDRDALAELLDALPHCAVLLASETRQLWGGGRSLALPGLSPEEGVALFAATLGRRLTVDEQEPVRQLCIRLGGNPLAIVQAAAAAEEDDRALLPFLAAMPSPTVATVSNALLTTRTTGERQVLAALAALDGAAIQPKTLAGALGAGRVVQTLAELADRGLVEAVDDRRYRLAAGLPVAATVEQRRQMLSAMLDWAQANHDQPALVGDESEALLALLAWADDNGRHAEVLALARALDAPLTLSGQWATWDQVMAMALHATRAAGDQAGKAWVLHQQGSRALLREDGVQARAALESALAIREQTGDTLGAHLTQYHLDLTRYLFPPPPTGRGQEPAPQEPPPVRTVPVAPPAGRSRWIWPVLIGVIALGVVAALLATGVLPWDPGAHAVPEPIAAGEGPSLRIVSPAPGTTMPPGEQVWLEVSLDGRSAAFVPGRIVWTVDRDLTIGEGAAGGATVPAHLESGAHILSARYTGDDGATSEAVTNIVVDRRPEVQIRQAGDGEVSAGERVTLIGEAGDAEDGDLSAGIRWSSSIDGSIGRGARPSHAFSAGTHTITAWVRDAAGNEAEAAVRLVVGSGSGAPPAPARNQRPTVRILEPGDGATFQPGTPIRFAAEAEDRPDGDLSERVVWRFGNDTVRGAEVRRELPPGRHTITADITDSGGLGASDRVTITVRGEEPPAPQPTTPPPAVVRQVPQIVLGELSIVQPTANGAVVFGTATASDNEDGPLDNAIQWWLGSRQNVIGYGPELEIELPPGEHLIVVFVADRDNMGAEDERRIVVPLPEIGNTVPRVVINRPLDEPAVRFGEAVALSATATDDQDGDISPAIVWRSSINGELGRGRDLIVDWLAPGLHTITAEVTDTAGAPASATTRITVGTNQPDLVAELTQTGPGTVIIGEGVYILVPVRVTVANVGGVAADGFMISAGGEGPGGRVQTTLVDMPGSDGRRVWIGAGMVVGQRVTLDGMLRIDNPAGLYGQVVSVWVMADNCAGDGSVPQDVCRVPESSEDNNRSPRIQVTLPPSPLE